MADMYATSFACTGCIEVNRAVNSKENAVVVVYGQVSMVQWQCVVTDASLVHHNDCIGQGIDDGDDDDDGYH